MAELEPRINPKLLEEAIKNELAAIKKNPKLGPKSLTQANGEFRKHQSQAGKLSASLGVGKVNVLGLMRHSEELHRLAARVAIAKQMQRKSRRPKPKKPIPKARRIK